MQALDEHDVVEPAALAAALMNTAAWVVADEIYEGFRELLFVRIARGTPIVIVPWDVAATGTAGFAPGIGVAGLLPFEQALKQMPTTIERIVISRRLARSLSGVLKFFLVNSPGGSTDSTTLHDFGGVERIK